MDELKCLATTDLILRLRPLTRALRRAAARRAATAGHSDQLRASCIGADEAARLLERLDGLPPPFVAGPARATAEEQASLTVLRTEAARASSALPLDALSAQARLDPFELECVLLCAAPEVDTAYERVIAYVLDDLNRSRPCIELLAGLTASSLPEALERRRVLAPSGALRRGRVLRASEPASSHARVEMRLGEGVLEGLTGATVDWGVLVGDEDELDPAQHARLPVPGCERRAGLLGPALGDGRLGVVGVWGRGAAEREAVVLALAAAAKLTVRRIIAQSVFAAKDPPGALRRALTAAATTGSLAWVVTDPEGDIPAREAHDAVLEAAIAATGLPVCVSGARPWRPAALLAKRAFAEVELERATFADRERLWSAALPEAAPERLRDVAARYRLDREEIDAAASLARATAVLNGNGHPVSVEAGLAGACSAVGSRRSYRFATRIKPRRAPADLVLPDELHREVLETAAFFRSWPRVGEEWGFGVTSPPGMRVLLSGAPGTGKTLAAEVIAGVLGLDMLKIDLAQVVSRWVGETEKNLDVAFDEAEDGCSLLFFDEADSLFGKRGEVRHGTDRYANLEVGYLLQRLEDHDGLVILATNLRENMDPAFTRRFDVVLHLPRPAEAERRRIWDVALPALAPLEPNVDLDALSRLDLTGAGIVATARTAALLAADEGAESIHMAHLVRAVSRQFRREARVLSPGDLGRFAALV